MIESINWSPGARELKKFGLALIIGFAVLGALFALRGRHVAAEWLMAVGGGVGFLALAAPPLSRPFYLAWMGLAFVLGTITSSVILTLIFFVILTPIALLMRLGRRDALHRRRGKTETSYWRDHPALDEKTYYERLS